jgi:glycosyltransferase involved in cell wall biosynthesis
VKKTKVVHIITRLDKGGSAENTFLTADGLDKTEYEVVLITGLTREFETSVPESLAIAENLKRLERGGVRILTVPQLVRNARPAKDLQALFLLYMMLRRERPQIVHTHTSKAGILGRWAARLAGCPIVVHTPHGHVFWGYFGPFRTSLFIFLEKWTAFLTDRIILLTKQEKKDHLRFGIAPENKFVTIHSGVRLEDFSKRSTDEMINMRKDLGLPRDALVVGTVGRLTPVKGQRFLIEAAQDIISTHPRTFFVFLGNGELRPEFLKRASESNIGPNILFLGWRPDVARVMSVFDIFVLPSLNEGMGKVLVEAMAAGKPIIASGIGGITDLVVDGLNGILVPPANSRALAREIRNLLDDEGRRNAMGMAGKSTAVYYGSGDMIQKIADLYRTLLKEKPVPVGRS